MELNTKENIKFDTHEHYAYNSVEFRKKKLGKGHEHYNSFQNESNKLGKGHEHYNYIYR